MRLHKLKFNWLHPFKMTRLFLQMWNKKRYGISKWYRFDEIVGNSDIKMILNKAIFSRDPVDILVDWASGLRKTMFLLQIKKLVKESILIIGSNTTKAGLTDRLFEARPKFMLVDELEKMNRNDQTSLVHLMETGIISKTKANKTR